MTRVNVIPVSELSDQWLIAEYRELPRCIKQDIDTSDAPQRYKLGAGHMKWAKKHSRWLLNRAWDIFFEMIHRGFKTNYTPEGLFEKAMCGKTYHVTNDDIAVNRARLIERFNNKHKWTNREKPKWLKI